ncbi:MAG: polysaccharide deacetylase family protein, partial [Delftia acidovorans]|nr:polysaccharide deacetylase family protein [Delftia acidovorans]
VIAALKAGGAPAMGFVNGVQLEREPASAPVLGKWRAAGLTLGNHGWSHANLDQLSDAQFLAELEKNEPILAARMGAADLRWFRYPFLSEAATDPARRARIRKLLAERGYKVATVTMDFSDWAYNDAYARCVASGVFCPTICRNRLTTNTVVLGLSAFVRKPVRSAAMSESAATGWLGKSSSWRLRSMVTPR